MHGGSTGGNGGSPQTDIQINIRIIMHKSRGGLLRPPRDENQNMEKEIYKGRIYTGEARYPFNALAAATAGLAR